MLQKRRWVPSVRDLGPLKVFAILFENDKYFDISVASAIVVCDLLNLKKVNVLCTGIAPFEGKQLLEKGQLPAAFIWQVNGICVCVKVK